MAEQTHKKKLSLSTMILMGMLLGIATGIFLGESAAFLQIIGDGFIKLLQMTILPYILVSLVLGIGSLTPQQAKLLAVKAGALLLLFWGISFAVIMLVPLSFPLWESAAFFSTSLVEPPAKVDFLNLYIPSNPFFSLANNVVPAVVLFSILIGIALMSIKKKQPLLDGLGAMAKALVNVTGMVVKLTPVGVFAISAAAAGTMTVEEFGRLQVYLVSFNLAALILTFGILPLLVTPVTPFKYRDIVGMSKDALITAFTTGNLFVVLTVLTENIKSLFEAYDLKKEKTDTYIDVMIPVSFNFPTTGKLIMLLFILFAAWFSGSVLSASQYVTLVFAGLMSFFGGVDVALPFMLDLMQLPADMYQLYLVTGIINGRTATLLAAMNLVVFTILATAAVTGVMNVRLKKLVPAAVTSVVLLFGLIIGSRAYFSLAVKNVYEKDVVVSSMQLLQDPAPTRLYREIPDDLPELPPSKTPMERIREEKTIRVGYLPDHMPWSYFNNIGELVGFDVDMANQLAKDFGWNLVFVPLDPETVDRQLERADIDVIMSGVPLTPSGLHRARFSMPYLELTAALIVRDHRREEFASVDAIRKSRKLKFGYVTTPSFGTLLEEAFPWAEIVRLDTPRDFLEENSSDLDALLMTAEEGSAWTLLYPKYQPVVPRPSNMKIQVAYPVARRDPQLADLISKWIVMMKGDPNFKKKYEYWIKGIGAEQVKPRWSVIRNLLGWGVEQPVDFGDEAAQTKR